MYCPSCGAPNNDRDQRYCRECGATLPVVDQSKRAVARGSDASRMPSVQDLLSPTPPASRRRRLPMPSGAKNTLIVAGAGGVALVLLVYVVIPAIVGFIAGILLPILAVLALGAIAYWYLRHGRKS